MNLKKRIEYKRAELQRALDYLKSEISLAERYLNEGRTPNPLGIVQSCAVDRLCGELATLVELNQESEK